MLVEQTRVCGIQLTMAIGRDVVYYVLSKHPKSPELLYECSQMRQPLCQLSVSAIKTRGNCSLGTTHDLRYLFVRESVDIFQKNWQPKLWFELRDCASHCFSDLGLSILLLLGIFFRRVLHCEDLPEWKATPAAPAFIHAGIDEEAIQPGGEVRSSSILLDGREQRQKNLLGHIIRESRIAT